MGAPPRLRGPRGARLGAVAPDASGGARGPCAAAAVQGVALDALPVEGAAVRPSRLPSLTRCAVPGCAASSYHAGDFVEVIFATAESVRACRVCSRCAVGDTGGLPAVAVPVVLALGAFRRAAAELSRGDVRRALGVR